MAFELDRFSPHSFEKFSQALVLEAYGADVEIYGAGPDGAREATYNGELRLNEDKVWTGYTVFQAKYLSSPKGDYRDADWLVKQIQAERRKFSDARRNLKVPKNYVIITNVRLSPVASSSGRKSKGGLEKVSDEFSKWDGIGLVEFSVWHAEKIETLLATSSELRTSHSAWVTPSDVLSAALLQISAPDAREVVSRSMVRSLKRDRDMKRKDAGQVTQKAIYLDQIFVDLPAASAADGVGYSPQQLYALRTGDFEPSAFASHENSGVVAKIVERARDDLRHSRCSAERENQGKDLPLRNRLVVLGGPGQGKSTVGQFVAQIFRAHCLQGQVAGLSAEASEVLDAVLQRAKEEGIPHNPPRRYPLHIELPKYADALSKAEDAELELPILDYAITILKQSNQDRISPDDLRQWLGKYPWVVVLDGLDEVPPTGNREAVIRNVNEFLDEAAAADADLLTIVTSRPQGYGDDFPRKYWEHWTLLDLAKADVMRFSTRLSEVLLSDGGRREEILSEIERAADDAATSPILVSPLQVAILFSLVETKGGVPADRWTLFLRHYELLRDREVAKEGSTAKLLREFKSHIDQIHFDAGFLLHLKAEQAGSADSYFEESEFEEVVDRQLRSEGFPDDEINRVKKEIGRLATQRLVLLGSKIDGRIAFDVRSLQEFMAAARIMSSPEGKIAARLNSISKSIHWRHVLRIAASKIYAYPSLRYLRQSVLGVCDSLDQGDPGISDSELKTGSRLALELLLDSVAVNLPEERRALVRRAFGLVRLGPNNVDAKFNLLIDEHTVEVVDYDIRSILRDGDDISREGAWKVVTLSIAEPGVAGSWAKAIFADMYDNETPEFKLKIVSNARGQEFQSLAEHAAKICRESTLRAVFDNLLSGNYRKTESVRDSRILPQVLDLRVHRDGHVEAAVFGLPDTRQQYTTTAIFKSADWSAPARGDWPTFSALEAFCASPCKELLADYLQVLLHGDTSINRLVLPWMVEVATCDMYEAPDPEKYISEVRSGGIGDAEDWVRAEDRFVNTGLTIEDFTYWDTGRYVGRDVAKIGAPVIYGSPWTSSEQESLVAGLVEAADSVRPMRKKYRLVNAAAIAARRLRARWSPTLIDHLSVLVKGCIDQGYTMSGTVDPSVFLESPVGLRVMNELGEKGGAATLQYHPDIEPLLHAIAEHPEQRGLLVHLAGSLREEGMGPKARARISPDLLVPRSHDALSVRAAISLLNIGSGRWDCVDEPAILDWIFELHDRRIGRLSTAMNAIGSTDAVDIDRSLQFLRRIVHDDRAKDVEVGAVVSARLLNVMERRVSSFCDSASLRELELPEGVKAAV